MLLEKILQAVFEDGKKFHGITPSHIPEAPEIGDEFLSKADEAISDHFIIDQTNWEDFTIYPATMWERLKRDAFAAGVQGRETLEEAQDIFGYDNPGLFQKELGYLNSFLDKPIVLQPVHLGRGEQGIMRRLALDTIAGQAGHWWNGQPSVGRWLVAMADQNS